MKEYPEIDVIDCDNHDERVMALKEQINDMSDWRKRVDACEKLMHLRCQQSKDILAKAVRRDPVYKVREAAHFSCRVLQVKRDGGLIKLGKKPPRCIYDGGIMNKLGHVRNTLENEFTYNEFKVKFKEMYPIEYDTYEGYQDNFDKWLRVQLTSFKNYMMYGDLLHDGVVTYVQLAHPNVYDTFINTSRGVIPIAEVKRGDQVYLKDDETLVPVISTFQVSIKALEDKKKRAEAKIIKNQKKEAQRMAYFEKHPEAKKNRKRLEAMKNDQQ